jgi:hypothetical protein
MSKFTGRGLDSRKLSALAAATVAAPSRGLPSLPFSEDKCFASSDVFDNSAALSADCCKLSSFSVSRHRASSDVKPDSDDM